MIARSATRIIFMGLILALTGSTCATWEAPDVPLPPDLKVVPPSPRGSFHERIHPGSKL